MSHDASSLLIRQLVLGVFETKGRLVDTGNALVRPLGLTTAWWQVIGALGYSPVPLPVAHIARNMGLTRQAVQRVVDELEKRGFVVFEANPHHVRARLVVLTPAGRAALQAAEAAVEPLDRRLLARLGAEPVAAAIAVLQAMCAELDLAAEERSPGSGVPPSPSAEDSA